MCYCVGLFGLTSATVQTRLCEWVSPAFHFFISLCWRVLVYLGGDADPLNTRIRLFLE